MRSAVDTSDDRMGNIAMPLRDTLVEYVGGLVDEPPNIAFARPEWHSRAACNGLTQLFFPRKGETSAPAKKVCDTCSFKQRCLEENINEPYGVWGGMTRRERTEIRKHKCGTESKYRAGCHCDDCTAAHKAWTEQQRNSELRRRERVS